MGRWPPVDSSNQRSTTCRTDTPVAPPCRRSGSPQAGAPAVSSALRLKRWTRWFRPRSWVISGPGRRESSLHGPGADLPAGGEAQLVQDVADMPIGGAPRHHQLRRYLRVGLASRDQPCDLPLAPRKRAGGTNRHSDAFGYRTVPARRMISLAKLPPSHRGAKCVWSRRSDCSHASGTPAQIPLNELAMSMDSSLY